MSITEDQLVVPTRDVDADIVEEPKFVCKIAIDDDDNYDCSGSALLEEKPAAGDGDDVTEIEKVYHLTAREQANTCRHYGTYDRLLFALPLLSSRNPNTTFTHAEIGYVVSAAREKVCSAVNKIRKLNPDFDLSCVNAGRGHRGYRSRYGSRGQNSVTR